MFRKKKHKYEVILRILICLSVAIHSNSVPAGTVEECLNRHVRELTLQTEETGAFDRLFYSDAVYTLTYDEGLGYAKDGCAYNISNLATQFQKLPEFDVSKARVLTIFNSERTELGSHQSFQMADSRHPFKSAVINNRPLLFGWGYHVVLEYRGIIYDFDHTGQPTPVSAIDYFKGGHFLTSNPGDKLHLKIRPVPAKDYVEDLDHKLIEHNGRKVRMKPDTYATDNNPDLNSSYPIYSPEDYLNAIAAHDGQEHLPTSRPKYVPFF